MNPTWMLILIIIFLCVVFCYINKPRLEQKELILKEIEERHAAQRAEMNILLKEFNEEYVAWMLYKSMSDQTPMSLLYKIYYDELLAYRKKWIDNFEKQCRDEMSIYMYARSLG